MSKGILNPGQLAVITEVLDDYCLVERIGDPAERDRLARKAVELYEAGVQSPGELRRALARAREE